MKLNRSIKPSPSAETRFHLTPIKKFTLENGLNVFFVKKTELPIINLNVIVNAGSKFDPLKSKGLANLLAMCIDEGAGDYNSLELSEQFDLLGAFFSINSNRDNIQITLQVLKENFEKSVKLLSSILTEPHLNEKNFKREQRKILTRLKQLGDEPDYLANTRFESLLFGRENPYSFPSLGLSEDISRITNVQIKSCFEKSILPNNSFIVAAGDISVEALKRIVEKYLSPWQMNEIGLNFDLKRSKDKKIIYIVNKKETVQTEIRVGHHSSGRGSDDYFDKHLLNAILGGQFTSRINLNLREKRGYTYGAGSVFNYFKDDAFFEVSTSVGIDNTADALSEIYYELNRIREGVTEEELQFAKSSIIRKFPLNFESYRQVSSNIISKVIFNLPEDYFDSYIQNIRGATIENVNNAALHNIFPDSSITILAGEKEKILPQLKSKDSGEIVIVD